MAHTNYRDMPSKVRNLEAFTHGSCHAVNNLDKEYVVVSYNTAVARAKKIDGEWHYAINSRKYSQTTSRLQGIIRRAWAMENVMEAETEGELYWH